MIKKILFISISFLPLILQPAELITGSDTSGVATFTTPISAHMRDSEYGILYVGALNAGAGEYALARLLPGTSSFAPIALQSVTLNGAVVENSPLYNQAISTVATMGGSHLAAITAANPNSLYVIGNAMVGSSVLSIENVQDAASAPSAGIAALAGAGMDSIFSAVIGSGQATFGAGNSGIALAKIQDTKENNQVVSRTLAQQSIVGLNGSSEAVAIANPVASMGTIVDMHWDPYLFRLYVAYNVQANAAANSGAYSVAVIYSNNATLQVAPIAPTTIFVPGNHNEIIGGIQASTNVTAQKVRTMRTSTYLNYLIVLGGNGTISGTNNTIYALPLVNRRQPSGQLNTSDLSVQGTLADVTQTPVLDFSDPVNAKNNVPLFQNRRFALPAQNNSQIYTTASVQAQVGGGPLAAGAITDMVVVGDTVFAVVGSASAGFSPGVFYSQALFNQEGVIVGWTEWAPGCATYADVFEIAYDPALGIFILISGSSASNLTTVQRTQWGGGSNPGLNEIVTLWQSHLSASNGGAQSLNTFQPGDSGVLNIGIAASVGLNKVILAQTGQIVASVFQPVTGGYKNNQASFDGGTITSAIPATTEILAIEGGVLSTLGPLQAVTIGGNDVNAWIFVGGTSGLAVLCNADGSGWSPAAGLTTGFGGIIQNMSFKKIGGYSFVKKLMVDNGFLYVLTDSQCDRINLASSSFANNQLAVTTLATVANIPSAFLTAQSFIDMVVSEKFILLATSGGLITGGANSNVMTANGSVAMNWMQVPIPLGLPVPVQIFPISSTGKATDVAVGIGGQLYVLNGDYGSDRAQLNRFYVSDTSSSPVTATTIQPLQDYMSENVLSYYGIYGSLRSCVATDGALFLSGRSRILQTPPLIITRFLNNGVSIPIDLSSFEQITMFARNYANGAWMVAGDFGLRVNE